MKKVIMAALCGAALASACSVTPESTQRAQAIAAQTNLTGTAGARALCAEGLVLRPSSAQPGATLVCLPAAQAAPR
jgi:hypothetical protein